MGQVHAVDNVTFDIGRSEFVCLVGPSGCGKSTMLNIIAGFLKPSGGEITIGGKAVTGYGMDRGVLFQDFAQLFPWRMALLADVWRETKKTVVYVTHNVAEAVFLADRVIVMSPHPGRLKSVVPMTLPRPRDPLSVEFLDGQKMLLREQKIAAIPDWKKALRPDFMEKVDEGVGWHGGRMCGAGAEGSPTSMAFRSPGHVGLRPVASAPTYGASAQIQSPVGRVRATGAPQHAP